MKEEWPAPRPAKRPRDHLATMLDCGKVEVNRGPLLIMLGAIKALRDGPDLSEIAEALFDDDFASEI